VTTTVLVLLPGLDGTGLLFRRLVDVLPDAVRPRVHAYSGSRAESYAELLPGVLAQLPRDEPFVLLGESFSGPLALMAAATRPAGLRAVILCATFVRNPVSLVPGWASGLVGAPLFRLYPVVVALKKWFGRFSTPGLRAGVAEALTRVERRVLAHRVRTVMRVDATEELRACPVPVLYLAGEHDWIVPARNLRRILRVRPDVRVARIGSPHMVLQVRPREAAAAIAAFIEALPQA